MTLFVGNRQKIKATVSGDMQKLTTNKQSKAMIEKEVEIPHAVSGMDERRAVDDLYLAWETVNPTSVPLTLKVAMTKLRVENLKRQVQSLKFPHDEEETASESSASDAVDESPEEKADVVPYSDCVEASYKNLERGNALPTSPSVDVRDIDDPSYKCHSEILLRRVDDDASRKCHSEMVRYSTDSPNSMIEDQDQFHLKEARSFDTSACNSSIATDSDSLDTAKGSWGIWKRKDVGNDSLSASSSRKSKGTKNTKKKNKNGSKGIRLVGDENASESSSKKSKSSKNSKNSKGSKGSLVGKVGSLFKKRPSLKSNSAATATTAKAHEKLEEIVAAPAKTVVTHLVAEKETKDGSARVEGKKQKKKAEPATTTIQIVETKSYDGSTTDKKKHKVNYEAIQSLLAECKSFDTAEQSLNTLDTTDESWGLWNDERFFAPEEPAPTTVKKANVPPSKKSKATPLAEKVSPPAQKASPRAIRASPPAQQENVNVILEAGKMLKKWSEDVATDFMTSREKACTTTKVAHDDIQQRCFTALESSTPTCPASMEPTSACHNTRRQESTLSAREGNPPDESYLDAVVDHVSWKLNMTCNEAIDNASSNLKVASDPRKYLCFAAQHDEYYPDDDMIERRPVGGRDVKGDAPAITRVPSILKPANQLKYTRSTGSDVAGDSLPTYSKNEKLNLLSFVLPKNF